MQREPPAELAAAVAYELVERELEARRVALFDAEGALVAAREACSSALASYHTWMAIFEEAAQRRAELPTLTVETIEAWEGPTWGGTHRPPLPPF